MKYIVTITLILMLLTPTAAKCDPGSAKKSKEEFLIGLIPEENIFKQMMRHSLLEDYLSEELGVPVRFTILSRYPHILTRFVRRDLDGAFFGAFTGILALENLNVETIARPVNLDGSMSTRGYIFTRSNSGISNIKQMRGKTIAFVDQVTATGYLYGLDMLKSKGIGNIKGYFKEEIFTGGHDTAVYTVLAGKAQVGVAKARIIDNLMQIDPMVKKEIKILFRSSGLPDNTLCIRKDMPEEFKLKLKNILLSMHRNKRGQAVLERFGAMQFTLAEPDGMVKRVGLNLKNLKYDY
jgi:phosphonate transport system substrate-binding protein